nr:MAG TPA: hypothetical protein [Caudoviricetes sp.]
MPEKDLGEPSGNTKADRNVCQCYIQSKKCAVPIGLSSAMLYR